MNTTCNGCSAMIYDILYMECAIDKCKKIYHLKCLALSKKQFEEMSEDFKASWRCPECMTSVPKGNNADTPVRGSTSLNKTFTPSSYVNTKRGNGAKILNDTSIESEDRLLDEMREFRLEMISRFEEQKQEYARLLDKFSKAESELLEIKQTMRVVSEKATKVDLVESKLRSLLDRNECLEIALSKQSQEIKERSQVQKYLGQSLSMNTVITTQDTHVEQSSVATKKAGKVVHEEKAVKSFVSAVKQNQIIQLNAQKCVATKPTGVVRDEERTKINVESKTQNSSRISENTESGETWALVDRRKSRYSNSEVRRGGSKQETEIKGTEKQKFLHVWRLEKDTTVENLEKFISKIIKDVPVKIEQIKHKMERNYASFRIGLPGSKYEQLCQTEIWPVNVEFCEWVWFRRTANHPISRDKKS